jgi:hypothetical protein
MRAIEVIGASLEVLGLVAAGNPGCSQISYDCSDSMHTVYHVSMLGNFAIAIP